jgi:hypothetical protein
LETLAIEVMAGFAHFLTDPVHPKKLGRLFARA